MKKVDTVMLDPLTASKLKKTFLLLKADKSNGCDDIEFNIAKPCFRMLHEPLQHILEISLEIRVFPNYLKIARVTSLFKQGDPKDVIID